MSRDVIWQPGHMAEEDVTMTADGHGVLIVLDKLVPFDLQQLSLAPYGESLSGLGVNREEGQGFRCIWQNRLHLSVVDGISGPV